MSVDIRRATMADYRQLCQLFEEGDVQHRDALPRMFRTLPGPARSYDHVAGLLADQEQALIVAESDRQLVGLAVARIQHSPDIPILVSRRYAHVGDLVVRKDHRRSGIGSALMQAVRAWAESQGVTEIQLNLWEFNEGALAFYESLGYRTMSRNMWLTLTRSE